MTLPKNFQLRPGQRHTQQIALRNSGRLGWPADTKLVLSFASDNIKVPDVVLVGAALPGSSKMVTIELTLAQSAKEGESAFFFFQVAYGADVYALREAELQCQFTVKEDVGQRLIDSCSSCSLSARIPGAHFENAGTPSLKENADRMNQSLHEME